ncbi:hypothetical protein ACJZ2D_005376 [Fusarium nematophilum]
MLVRALAALALVAASDASPCKPKEIPTISTSTGSATSDITTGTATTTGTTTEEVSQSTDTTTTTLLTTTAPTSTTDTTTAAQSTTTTSLPNLDPDNWSFDVQPQSLSPWQVNDIENEATLNLDTTIVHSGLRSARFYSGPTWNWKTITRPLDKSQIMANVPVIVSAWFRTDAYYGGNPNSGIPGCASAGLFCSWPGQFIPPAMGSASTMVEQWQKVTSTCTFTQAQLDSADTPLIRVGGTCAKATLWIDDVVITYVQGS